MPHPGNLPDTPNFRDFGGKATADGGMVRSGHFFRSPALDALSERDLAALQALDPEIILDLRGVEERARAPNRLSETLSARIHSVPVEPSVGPRIRRAMTEGRLTGAVAEDIMAEAYRGFVETSFDRFTEALRIICRPRKGPVVFHCTAGKDRTGFLAYLILSALGVSRDVILADYLASNARWRPAPAALSGLPEDAQAAIVEVRPSYLDAAINALSDSNATPDTLSQVLGVQSHRSFVDWATRS